MIYNRFTLITPNLPDVTIDEPMGYAEIVQGMIRKEDWHGVYFQATVNELGFYGEAAAYLTDQKQVNGIKAVVTFLAESRCKESDPWEEELRGRLNFGRFKSLCGVQCTVTMPVEQEGCAMAFTNRFDQAVNIDSLVAFDKITGLAPYSGLNMSMTLAAQEQFASVEGDVGPDGWDFLLEQYPMTGPVTTIDVRPVYQNVEDQSINIANLAEPYNEFGTKGGPQMPTTPVLLLDDEPRCSNGLYDLDIRIKGTYDVIVNGGDEGLTILALIFEDDLQDPVDAIEFASKSLFRGSTSNAGTFDISYVATGVELRQGYGIYTIIRVLSFTNQLIKLQIHWDPETHVSIKTTKACPPTESRVFMVNEVMSRAAEAITNNCIKVKSDYYGRVDSEPYSSGADGCGSLRVLTNGLNLRKATQNNDFFVSWEQLFNDQIRAIDNCGMGFEPNPEIPGYDVLRVEPIEYFYQDYEVLRFPYAPQVNSEVDEKGHYSVIKGGYNTWEPKAIQGLNEYNSTREWRTSLDSIKNPLDISSNFIAAGSVVESVRRESFAESGKQDTTYDNNTFIICIDRDGPYGLKVEQGEIAEPANIFSPASSYNFRITPLRNLMRHFKSIINSYANIVNSSSKIFFSKGTGNYTATGRLMDDCADENAPKAENIDLSIYDFKNQADYVPLVRPETVNFQYPFTASDWSKLRARPNGYCSVQCGTGEWLKFYITELQWTRKLGTAEIKGKVKWQ